MEATAVPDAIVPIEYPALAELAWNREPACPIAAAEAFALYERNWRHVDVARLTQAETALIDRLIREYGGGHLLVG